jgi:hypothetical protein
VARAGTRHGHLERHPGGRHRGRSPLTRHGDHPGAAEGMMEPA